eukprot:Filipodium_phascolosomae@DN5341_c0_g1_i1.p2
MRRSPRFAGPKATLTEALQESKKEQLAALPKESHKKKKLESSKKKKTESSHKKKPNPLVETETANESPQSLRDNRAQKRGDARYLSVQKLRLPEASSKKKKKKKKKKVLCVD